MAITYDPTSNVITVTGYTEGTPCDFDELRTADMAGTLQLKPSTAILPYPGWDTDREVRPADSLALRITCVITNYSAPGTLTIEGLDAYGVTLAYNWAINGNGTRVTPAEVRFSQIDRVYSPGTFDVEVTQDRWGVVWKTGATQFTLDCKVQIGDGSTNTWFATELEQAVFTLGLLRSLFANGGYYATKAHLRIGKLDGNGEPCNGSTLFFDNTASNYVAVFDVYNCDVEMYDSQIYIEGMGFVQWLQSAIGVLDGSMNVKRSRMQSDTPTHGQLVVKIADAQIDGLELQTTVGTTSTCSEQ